MSFCLCPAVQAHICRSQAYCQSSQLLLFISPCRGRKNPRQSPAKRKQSNHAKMEYCHYFCYLFFNLSDITGTVAGIASRLEMKKHAKITLNIVSWLNLLNTHLPLLHIISFKLDKETLEGTGRFAPPASPHPPRSF